MGCESNESPMEGKRGGDVFEYWGYWKVFLWNLQADKLGGAEAGKAKVLTNQTVFHPISSDKADQATRLRWKKTHLKIITFGCEGEKERRGRKTRVETLCSI